MDDPDRSSPVQKDTRPDADNRRFGFPSLRSSRDPLSELSKLAASRGEAHHKGNGSNSDSRLTVPQPRESFSSPDGALDSSSREDLSHSVSNDTRHNSADSSRPSGQFSWLSRKQRNRKSLFPLLDRPDKPHTAPPTAAASPRPSTSAIDAARPKSTKYNSERALRASAHSHPGSGSGSIHFAPHPAVMRRGSITSDHSAKSSPALAPPGRPTRHRSSTVGSHSENSEDSPPTPPFVGGGSGRNSTSTAGRSSLSNLFGLGRFRHEPNSPRTNSATNISFAGGTGSMSNSMTLSREVLLPDREEGETAMQYLERVEDLAHRSQIPSILSKSGDEFRHTVMRSFMRKFAYFGDPLDMAIRKLLMEIDLPKETQQIDRVLQSFADRYHECNPGIFGASGEYCSNSLGSAVLICCRQGILHLLLHTNAPN